MTDDTWLGSLDGLQIMLVVLVWAVWNTFNTNPHPRIALLSFFWLLLRSGANETAVVGVSDYTMRFLFTDFQRMRISWS